MRNLRTSVLALAGLVGAVSFASGQTARDTTHSNNQQPKVAVTLAHLQQYCKTKKPAQYLCADTATLRTAFIAEQALLISSVVPVDTLAEPVFDPVRSTMLFQQNFDKYTTDSLHFPCGTAPSAGRVVDHAVFFCSDTTSWKFDANVTVIPGRSGNGIGIRYAGASAGDAVTCGYQETHGVVTTGGTVAPTGKAGIVVQYWARFTTDVPAPYKCAGVNGFGSTLTSVDTNGVGNAVVQIKNIMLWHDQNRFQIMSHAHGECPTYGPSYTMFGVIDQVQVGCTSDQPLDPFFKDIANGQWRRWTIYYKPNTSQGSRDGIARLWIDGKLILRIEKGACDVTPPGGWKTWCDWAELDGIYSGAFGVNLLEWGANRTDGTGIAFTMAIDDVKWWKPN